MDPNSLENSFGKKPLTIQRNSSDPNTVYPVWDIRKIITENERELPLYFAITPEIDPNLVSRYFPGKEVKIIEKNIPHEWLTLSSNRELADFDDNGVVDVNDYTYFLNDLGKTGPSRSDIWSNQKQVIGIPDKIVDPNDEKAFIDEHNRLNPENPL